METNHSAIFYFAGTDSSRTDVVNSYPYNKKNGRKIMDTDNDGVADDIDNCPFVANTDQLNTDADTLGDACEPDDDNDGIADEDRHGFISIFKFLVFKEEKGIELIATKNPPRWSSGRILV